MKYTIQIIILVLGTTASIYGISKMASETATMIFPPWLIVGVISLIVGAAAVGIGFIIKRLLHADWHSLTFASIIVIIIVSIDAIAAGKPTIRIIISPEYSGEVRLFVRKNNSKNHEIKVDNLGIGYINRKDFDQGFYPKIIKGSIDITKSVRQYSKGTFSASWAMTYSIDYLSFVIPGRSTQLVSDIDDLIRMGSIDTMQLPGNGNLSK
jgi:Predicted protease of the Abi (CAAX) family